MSEQSNEPTPWIDFLPDVLFHKNDLLGDPIYITTMITPPRQGEIVSLPGQPFHFVGKVKLVNWSFEEGRVFCSIILEEI